MSHTAFVQAPRKFSKSAPDPVSWDALPEALRRAVHLWPKDIGHGAHGLAAARHARRCRRRLGLAVGTLAVRPVRAGELPPLVLREAELAGATPYPLGVVVRVLVERDGVRRVGIAKDVPTAPTVVPAREVSKCPSARSLVADGGLRVRLSRRVSTTLEILVMSQGKSGLLRIGEIPQLRCFTWVYCEISGFATSVWPGDQPPGVVQLASAPSTCIKTPGQFYNLRRKPWTKIAGVDQERFT